MVSRAPAARLVILALLGAPQAGADELDFRTDLEGEVTFKNTGVSDVASAMLTETQGIVCYCDWENPEEGKCNAVDFSDSSAPVSGPSVLLANFSKNHRFTVARFSDAMGVACYTPFGTVGGKPACLTLSLSGSGSSATLSAGDIFEFDPYSTFSYALSVVSLTDSTGLLCYQDTTSVYNFNRRDLTCLVLEVSGGGLSSAAGVNASKTYANAVEWDNIVDISMAKVSDTSAVVCYADGTEEKALCNRLSLAGSGDELAVGPEFLLGEGLAGSGSDSEWALLSGVLSVAALSEERGVACFCGSGAGPTCVPLGLDNATEVSSVGDALAVEAASCSEVSLVAMSETGAIACYLSGEDGVGTCSGLVLNHGHVLTAGDATEIPASGVASDNSFVEPSACSTNECDMWISLSSATGGASAVACYAGVGGSETGRCRGLSIPPPTSTTTVSTATETSSTTEHSTTETSSTTATETSTLTSSTTATSTTVTTATETSSTTPHTTTATETTMTTVTLGPEDSGARAAGYAVALIGAVTSLLM